MVYLFDALILVTLGAAIYLGITRSWKVSFASTAAHLLSMGTTWALTALLTPFLVDAIAYYVDLTSFLPVAIGFWIAPFQRNILYTVIFSFLFILLFTVSKSILHAFSWTYEWGMALFGKWRLPRLVDAILSAFFTALQAATWLWGLLLAVAFPFFNLDKSYSLVGLLLALPLFQQQATALYAPYGEIQTAIAIIGDDLFTVWDGDSINPEALNLMDAAERREFKYNLVEALPYLPPELNGQLHQILTEIKME